MSTPRPWPENVEPTPEQLADWLRDCTDDERRTFATLAIRHSAVASRCFMAGHGERIERSMADGLAVAEHLLRKVADYWDGRPLMHHGDHIYADLLDVLKAITPVDQDGDA